MRGADLLQTMEYVDLDLVDAADQKPQRSSQFPWIPFAACLCLAALSALIVVGISVIQGGKGVTVPGIDYTKAESVYSMGQVVVYQGRLYTLETSYSEEWMGPEKFSDILALLGDSLGETDGKYLVPEKDSDIPVSTKSGEVFTVQGYDPQFRICISYVEEDEEGRSFQKIDFMENLNDMVLQTGKDLLEGRLHLAENWQKAVYYPPDPQKGANLFKEEPQEIEGVSRKEIEKFIESMSTSPFVQVSDEQMRQFYSGTVEERAIAFMMEDGTQVRFYLFEGGYVQYAGLGEYMIKMPEENFAAVYECCGEER